MFETFNLYVEGHNIIVAYYGKDKNINTSNIDVISEELSSIEEELTTQLGEGDFKYFEDKKNLQSLQARIVRWWDIFKYKPSHTI